jgi:hypothetical protein
MRGAGASASGELIAHATSSSRAHTRLRDVATARACASPASTGAPAGSDAQRVAPSITAHTRWLDTAGRCPAGIVMERGRARPGVAPQQTSSPRAFDTHVSSSPAPIDVHGPRGAASCGAADGAGLVGAGAVVGAAVSRRAPKPTASRRSTHATSRAAESAAAASRTGTPTRTPG